MSKRALICGVTGQDGSLLAKLLLEKGYQVVGTSRDSAAASIANLIQLEIDHDVSLSTMSSDDLSSVERVFDQVAPDEVYNLAGQSSVSLSFNDPVETLRSHVLGSLNLLEAVRLSGSKARLFNAGSGDCFGGTGSDAADETRPFQPRSPYAVAKAASFWETRNYRDAYGVYACTGILFNHESPLRPVQFVTKKIVAAVCRIANGSKEKLKLGNLTIRRDWGWAEEYVDAMWRMLQQETAEDYVIATGVSYSLEEFVASAFECAGLDWHDHVVVDSELIRESDIFESRGDASKAETILGWKATRTMSDVVKALMAAENVRVNTRIDKRA